MDPEVEGSSGRVSDASGLFESVGIYSSDELDPSPPAVCSVDQIPEYLCSCINIFM